MRVQVEDLPRILSTRTSSTARCAAASEYFFFHLSRPARAISSLGDFAITRSGILVRDLLADFFAAVVFAADFARDGDTRGDSPSALRKCGGHRASPRPADSSRAARSSKGSSEP